MKAIKITIFALGLLTFTQSYTQEATDKQKKRFNQIDKNHNGTIEISELKADFKGKKTKKGKPYNAYNFFIRKDIDESGRLSLKEFITKPKKK